MINQWELPTSIEVGGSFWKIRSDFRVVLDILRYFTDPDYEDDERLFICLDILYEDYEKMPDEIKRKALEKAFEFIDMGIKEDTHKQQRPSTMDWEQDAPIIIPAINKTLGYEIRAKEYLHWWTFLSAYMEIGECLFSQVLNIRQKKQRGKKLEKWEKEFYRENKAIITLEKKVSEENQAEIDRLNALLR